MESVENGRTLFNTIPATPGDGNCPRRRERRGKCTHCRCETMLILHRQSSVKEYLFGRLLHGLTLRPYSELKRVGRQRDSRDQSFVLSGRIFVGLLCVPFPYGSLQQLLAYDVVISGDVAMSHLLNVPYYLRGCLLGAYHVICGNYYLHVLICLAIGIR